MDDRAIVFLHGFATHCGVFVRQIGLFKNEYTVIAPDMYELMPEGASDSFSIDSVVNAISEEITGNGIKEVFIFGWSFGGIVAAKLYRKLQDITSGVIFCGFCPVFTKGDKNPYGMPASEINKLRERIDTSALTAIEEFVKLVMHGYQYTSDFEMIKELILDEISEDKRDILKSSLSVLEEGDFTEDVKAIKAKSLIIHGTQDKLCQKEAIDEMAKLLDDCEVKVLEGASHIPFFTNAGEFNNTLKEFLHGFA